MEANVQDLILALDVSSSCIGIALFQDLGDKLDLKLLTHVSPKVKPKPETKTEELFKKIDIFEAEFLSKYINFDIKHVIIEEPLLASNNIYTVATLLRFNGMLAKMIYDKLGVVPEFISSYDSRKFAFPQLMQKRTVKKDGTKIPEKQTLKNKEVLFGGYDYTIDKKQIIWQLVSDEFPKIEWFFDKKNKLIKESYDMSDAVCVGLSWFNRRKLANPK